MRNKYIIFISMLLIITAFCVFLLKGFHGYFIFLIVGFTFYIVSKKYGREIYLLIPIPIFCISTAFSGSLFILDYYDRNGLNVLKLHPFTIAWLVVFTMEFLERLVNKKNIFDKITLPGWITILVFLAVTLLKRGMNGMPLIVENYVGPITYFLFFYLYGPLNVKKVDWYITIFISCTVIIGLFGVSEYILQSNIFDSVYEKLPSNWLEGVLNGGYRVKTIIGHPLTNALVFLMVMLLVEKRFHHQGMKYALLSFFSIVILLTGSRSMFLLSIMIFLNHFTSIKNITKKRKEIFFSAVVFFFLIIIVMNTYLGSTFMYRMENGYGSSEARIVLLRYFLHNLNSFIIRGLGGSENIHIYNPQNQPIIMENPWIILFFEVSYLIVIYLIFIGMVVWKLKDKFLILIFIMALTSNNSFGVKGVSNYMLYFLFSYYYIRQQWEKSAVCLVEA